MIPPRIPGDTDTDKATPNPTTTVATVTSTSTRSSPRGISIISHNRKSVDIVGRTDHSVPSFNATLETNTNTNTNTNVGSSSSSSFTSRIANAIAGAARRTTSASASASASGSRTGAVSSSTSEGHTPSDATITTTTTTSTTKSTKNKMAMTMTMAMKAKISRATPAPSTAIKLETESSMDPATTKKRMTRPEKSSSCSSILDCSLLPALGASVRGNGKGKENVPPLGEVGYGAFSHEDGGSEIGEERAHQFVQEEEEEEEEEILVSTPHVTTPAAQGSRTLRTSLTRRKTMSDMLSEEEEDVEMRSSDVTTPTTTPTTTTAEPTNASVGGKRRRARYSLGLGSPSMTPTGLGSATDAEVEADAEAEADCPFSRGTSENSKRRCLRKSNQRTTQATEDRAGADGSSNLGVRGAGAVALGKRSISYNESMVASSSSLNADTSTSSVGLSSTNERPTRRRSEAASNRTLGSSGGASETATTTTTTTTNASTGTRASTSNRRLGRRREASVSSTISIRSEHTPAPSSSSATPATLSARSAWCQYLGGGANDSSSDIVKWGQQTSEESLLSSSTLDIIASAPLSTPMDLDEPFTCLMTPSTPPSQPLRTPTEEINQFSNLAITPKRTRHSRTSSSTCMKTSKDLDKTPTRRKVLKAPVISNPPISSLPMTPELSNRSTTSNITVGNPLSELSSSPEEGELLITPPHMTVSGIHEEQSTSTTPSKVRKLLDGFKALKQVLRCSSSVGGLIEIETSETEANDIIGRSVEKEVIQAYLSSGKTDSKSLYISGPPGTGKTALISSSLSRLPPDQCKVSFVNCMGLSTTGKHRELWSRVGKDWELIDAAKMKKTKETEQQVVEQGLKTSSQLFVLVLDEVDFLLNANSKNSAQLLHTLLSLPAAASNNATVKVISISNSLDLTSRKSISALLGNQQPNNLTFAAYGNKEMVEIIKSRVQQAAQICQEGQPIQFDDKAIELVARKVEASNGDLRMCLSVSHGAVGVAEDEWKKKLEKVGPGATPSKINLSHVLKSLTAYNKLKASAAYGSGVASSSGSSAVDNKVRSLNLQVRIILLALIVARRRASLGLRPAHASAASLHITTAPSPTATPSIITAEALYPTYVYLLTQASSPFAPAAHADYLDLVMQAEVVGLVLVEGPGGSPSKNRGRKAKSSERPMELLVREQDMLAALGIGKIVDAKTSVAIESEIRLIWGKEEHRWQAALETKQKQAQAAADSEGIQFGFDEDEAY